MNDDAATRHPFEYVVLRVVPRVDRGESINAGVVVYCRALDYLDPAADPELIESALASVYDVCTGGPDAGPAAREDIGRRFRWLTAPRSTVVQPGPVHTGLTADPVAELDRLLQLLVSP